MWEQLEEQAKAHTYMHRYISIFSDNFKVLFKTSENIKTKFKIR